jgi:hypothetical protein
MEKGIVTLKAVGAKDPKFNWWLSPKKSELKGAV